MLTRSLFAIFLIASPLAAKDKDAKPNYAVNCDDPHAYSCTQYLQLKLKQQKVLEYYGLYQNALADLNTEADVIKRENGWPADVKFNGELLTFTAPMPINLPATQENK